MAKRKGRNEELALMGDDARSFPLPEKADGNNIIILFVVLILLGLILLGLIAYKTH